MTNKAWTLIVTQPLHVEKVLVFPDGMLLSARPKKTAGTPTLLGNPAVFNRPVAFRPYLTTGLALSSVDFLLSKDPSEKSWIIKIYFIGLLYRIYKCITSHYINHPQRLCHFVPVLFSHNHWNLKTSRLGRCKYFKRFHKRIQSKFTCR